MNKMHGLLISIASLLSAQTALAQEADQKIVFDMRYGSEKTVEYTALPGKFIVEIHNMIPSQRIDYAVNIEQKFHSEPPLTMNGSGITNPSNQPGQRDQPVANITCADDDNECKEHIELCGKIIMQSNVLSGATTENAVADAIANLKKYSENLAYSSCTTENERANSLIALTKAEYIVNPSNRATIIIQVKKKGVVFSETKLKPYKTRWSTHLGFTFVANQGDSFYSENVSEDPSIADYIISPQNNEHDILYSATGIWTYSFKKWDSGIDLGLSVGLGANNQSILVLTGPSFIFGENFLINLGIVAQEFQQLKGTYKKGQALGSTSVDSSDLANNTFKISYGLTFGLRFGN